MFVNPEKALVLCFWHIYHLNPFKFSMICLQKPSDKAHFILVAEATWLENPTQVPNHHRQSNLALQPSIRDGLPMIVTSHNFWSLVHGNWPLEANDTLNQWSKYSSSPNDRRTRNLASSFSPLFSREPYHLRWFWVGPTMWMPPNPSMIQALLTLLSLFETWCCFATCNFWPVTSFWQICVYPQVWAEKSCQNSCDFSSKFTYFEDQRVAKNGTSIRSKSLRTQLYERLLSFSDRCLWPKMIWMIWIGSTKMIWMFGTSCSNRVIYGIIKLQSHRGF